MKKQKKIETEFQILRAFIEARFAELKAEIRRALGTAQAAPVAPKAKVVRARVGNGSQAALLGALKSHKKGKELVKAGKQPDQLLRSLIPLYLARGVSGVEVNSGAISHFWKAHGVSYAGPNAAKALRGHVGMATKAGKGWAITPNGVKYVEAALSKKLAA